MTLKDQAIDHFLQLLYEQQVEIMRLRVENAELEQKLHPDPQDCKHDGGLTPHNPYDGPICNKCGEQL